MSLSFYLSYNSVIDMAKHCFCSLKGYNSSILHCHYYAKDRIRYTDRLLRHRQMDKYIQNNPTVSFDECDRYRYMTVSAQNRALWCKRGQTWTSCLHFRRHKHVRTIKDSETEGGRQAVQQLFLRLCWSVSDREATLSIKRSKLRECWAQSVKVKGLT